MEKGLLFIDTETTGKFDFKSDPTADHQPRIIQFAALLTDRDGKTMASYQSLVAPDGWKIEAEAEAVHGISAELCGCFGIAIRSVVNTFGRLSLNASTIIAHNIEFDEAMMRREFALLHLNYPERERFCTMHASTDQCKLPGRYGDYKWPKLTEAYQHFFGKPFDGAHDAMADVLACRDVYFAIKKLEPVGA